MKKLIMFFMVLMLCLGFVGEVEAVPDCVTICPAGGPDDEITLTVYDEEGEFVDLSLIGGAEIEFWDPEGYFYIGPEDPEMVDGSVVIVLGEALYNAIYCGMSVDGAYFNLGLDKEGPGTFESFSDAVDAGGTCPEEIPVCRESPSPIVIDPNVMLVYETDETRGDFSVSMKNPMEPETSVTVTVDPNQAADDITLVGAGVGGTITLIFDANDWDVPQRVVFEAIDDLIAETPYLVESQNMVLTSVYSEPLQDPNWAGEKLVKVKVMDNDQADILFELVGTGPIREEDTVTLFEYANCTYWYLGVCYNWVTFPQTIGVTMQVEPENDESPGSQGYVRVIVSEEGGAGNPPSMDPPLLPDGPVEPNAIVFTSDGNPVPGIVGAVRKWDVPFNIVVVGIDDDQLQAEGAEAEGGQFYQASLVFSVTDTTDARYTPETEPEGLERTVDIEIEDNECGAYGISYLDTANSSGEDEPDCHVDIYDVIEFATKWLDCSDPQDAGCESYL